MLLRRRTDWSNLERRSPFEELERLRRQMDWFTGGMSGRRFEVPFSGVFPLLNLTEDKNSYFVRAELPGIKANELDISVTGNTLSISGERKIAAEREGAKYHRREREAGSFSRVITLPGQIDTAKVEADSTNGVLTVVLPKAEVLKSKQITVKAS